MARLTPDTVRRAREAIALYPRARSALIPVLHLAQEQDGWLTEDAMAHVAELLELTPAEVYGTASFYDMLFTEPVGRHLVSICTNIACLLNGAYELLEHAEERLGVKPGATTADGQFTLEEVECLALCGQAPCLTVNWRFFGDVTDDGFDRLVDDLASGRLADTVPPHGTLCRVRRTVGLPAGIPLEGRAPEAAGPPAAPAADPPARHEKGDNAEAGPADATASETSTEHADATERPAGTTTAPEPAGTTTSPAAAGTEPQKDGTQ